MHRRMFALLLLSSLLGAALPASTLASQIPGFGRGVDDASEPSMGFRDSAR